MSYLEQLDTIPDTRAMPEEYVDILLKATPPNWRGVFVLDGLDEMPEEEVNDIFDQFQHLRKHRWVSVLCSSRPTSACYSIASSKADEIRTLSMEAADRSEEIRTYLEAEISRWNTIRPLSTELQRLVEEQLLAGCQGMLLWLSLQIEDICPRYTQELRSDAEILDILGNLPSDLPGAFKKALSRVRDGKYGCRLFKLVASAEPPLNMDELRVASNVEPGNTHWDSSTLASSGKTLISAYGGSLLDIDEEDLCIRFIHYSVLLHLTAPSSDDQTRIFHFDLEEAERTLGAVCVTYLNYSVFENRISTAQKASFGQVPGVTARSVMPLEGFRKGLSLLAKHRRQRDPKVDLERLSYELQSERWRVRDDVHLFLDYAKERWLLLARDIWRDDHLGILSLWRDLLRSPIVSASIPWDSVSEAAAWALGNGHATLFQHYLHSDDRDHLQAVLSATERAVATELSGIRLKGHGLGWLAPLYLECSHYQAPTLQAFIALGCQPFKPRVARSSSTPFPKLVFAERVGSQIMAALESYSDTPEMRRRILFLANYWDDPDLVPDNQPATLQLAIRHGHASLALELLSKGVNPDGRGRAAYPSPLVLSINANFLDLAQRLVELGADITTTLHLYPYLFSAIDKSHWGLFSALLLRDPPFSNTRYGFKMETAYHHLCAGEVHVEPHFAEVALEALIQHGADKNLANQAGETPLLLAVKAKMSLLTEILVKYDVNPNFGDHLGARPLHYAQDTKTIQHLLRRGADPDAVTVHARVTPLMAAAYQGRADVVKALLKGGAHPDLRLSSNLSSEDVLVISWPNESSIKFEPGATAFQLCFERLETEMEFCDMDYASTEQLCSDLLSIITEFAKLGVRNRLDCYKRLARLGSLRLPVVERSSNLSLDLQRTLDLFA